MSTYHMYANVNVSPPIVGLATSNPPQTGGVVLCTFETDEPDHNKRLKIAESLASPFRLEDSAGQSVATARPASSAGLDEALMEGGALARANPRRPLRLVGGAGVVLRRWNYGADRADRRP